MRTFHSRAWTGRELRYPGRWLARLCYPSYECEQCVGQEYWQGCYCAYHGASAPCHGPEGWRAALRAIVRVVYCWPAEEWEHELDDRRRH